MTGRSFGPGGISAYDRSAELAALGPLIDIVIRPPALPFRQPQPHARQFIRARGLIDTGATDVCIDISMAAELGLTPTGREQVGVAGGASMMAEVFAGCLEVPELGFSEVVPLYALKTRRPTHDVLLGRSFLRNFIVTFDGPQGVFHFYKPTPYGFAGPDEHDE